MPHNISFRSISSNSSRIHLVFISAFNKPLQFPVYRVNPLVLSDHKLDMVPIRSIDCEGVANELVNRVESFQ